MVQHIWCYYCEEMAETIASLFIALLLALMFFYIRTAFLHTPCASCHNKDLQFTVSPPLQDSFSTKEGKYVLKAKVSVG